MQLYIVKAWKLQYITCFFQLSGKVNRTTSLFIEFHLFYLITSIPSRSISWKRKGLICLWSLTMSTEHCSNSSKNLFSLTTRKAFASMSTQRSMSLPTFCSFLTRNRKDVRTSRRILFSILWCERRWVICNTP